MATMNSTETSAATTGDPSTCERRGKWFGGCRFEPRYDLGAADLTPFDSIKATSSAMFETLRTKTYVCDVCVRCGKTIERSA